MQMIRKAITFINAIWQVLEDLL